MNLDKASSTAHAAVESAVVAADEVVSKAKPAIDRVAAMAHHAVDKAAGVAAPTADWLNDHGKSLKAGQLRLAENTCGYIAEHPMKSIGAAVVAGFLLSRFLLK
jgi:ElaB/YqjD/DUF883 family membrane-anchored ribosome-binding protein